MEHFKTKYLKSIINVLEQHKEMSEEDRANLNQCVGSLFQEIRIDGNMTEELAKELGLAFLLPSWKEVKLDERKGIQR